MTEQASRTVAPLREFSLDTGFGRITGLRRDGSHGRKVLALHGWLDNAASFVPLAPCLGDVDLVAVDLPGHGGSAHLPLAGEYTVVNSARAGFAIADALGWDTFTLLAHSLGGAIASVMAAAQPQRIEGLMLIEALGALAETEDCRVERLRAAFSAQAAASGKKLRVFADTATAVQARMRANGLSEAVARLLVERGVAPAQIDEGDGSAERGYVWRSDPRLTQPTSVRLSEEQVRALIEGIECPTRVIYATPAQFYFPEAQRQERAALLRDGTVIEIAGSHHLHMEAPAVVAEAIGDFLD